jgi:predicted acetyltransferase
VSATTDLRATGILLQAVDADSPQLHDWLTTAMRGLKFPDGVPPERTERRRPVLRGHRVTAATDGDAVVGTFRSWDLDLTVPGTGTAAAGTRSLRADAISSVTVSPTHRRRGILTAMMTADLTAAAERGIPVAVLIASEGGIYGRFGFGVGTRSATWTLDVPRGRFRADLPPRGGCRIVEAADLRPLAPQIYRRSRTAGANDRTDEWWDVALGIAPLPGDRPQHHVGVVHHDSTGEPDGLLLYRVEERWDERISRAVVHVAELVTATPGAYRDLWRYLSELDLVATVRAEDRPVDEPLPWLLADQRAARPVSACDFEWTRLLDPAAALSARAYEVPGEAVFEVTDPAGWAAGRYRLQAEPDATGHCSRTDQPAELTLTVQALSALWLGDHDLTAAVLAGQAVEHRPGAALRLGRMLRTARAPWTSTWF